MKKYIFLLVILILFIILIHLKKTGLLETFNNFDKKNYLCLLCVKLSPELLTFAKQLSIHHKIFIMVDNNDTKLPNIIDNINILQMDDQECINLGYKNASATLKKNPVTWDKVFYYFSNIDTNFNHIWFVEEDVFVPTFDYFSKLDQKYPNIDLICKNHIAHKTDKQQWHWSRAKGNIPKPWFRSILCCHRQSRRNLQKVKEYVQKNGKLLFLEFLINTLASHNNHSVKTLPEFKTITWRNKIDENNININNLYHPVKDLKKHLEYRKRIQ